MSEEQMDLILFALYHAKLDCQVNVEFAKSSESPLLKYYENLLSELKTAHKIMQDYIHEQIIKKKSETEE